MDMPVSRLEALNLEKTYGSRTVVHDVSIAVQKGEVVGLLGPNGAGKTTSFYMIVGLVRADSGSITIDGKSVTDLPIHRRSRLGLSYLPQEASIFRKLNVEDNVRAVLELQRDDKDQPWAKPKLKSAWWICYKSYAFCICVNHRQSPCLVANVVV